MWKSLWNKCMVSNIGSLLIMKVTEQKSKGWIWGKTHLKQMIKLNAHLELSVLIYVKRCIKSAPGKIISICISFFYVLRVMFLHTTEVLRGLILKCLTKNSVRTWGVYGDPSAQTASKHVVWGMEQSWFNSGFLHLPWASSLASVSD